MKARNEAIPFEDAALVQANPGSIQMRIRIVSKVGEEFPERGPARQAALAEHQRGVDRSPGLARAPFHRTGLRRGPFAGPLPMAARPADDGGLPERLGRLGGGLHAYILPHPPRRSSSPSREWSTPAPGRIFTSKGSGDFPVFDSHHGLLDLAASRAFGTA